MPNATGANSPAMPEAANPPDAHARILEQRRRFERACTRWLKARAVRDDPDEPKDDESGTKRDLEYAQAERELILVPAIFDWMVWDKIEVFELALGDEMRVGPRADCFLILAIGAIKADLLRLGIGSEALSVESGRLQ